MGAAARRATHRAGGSAQAAPRPADRGVPGQGGTRRRAGGREVPNGCTGARSSRIQRLAPLTILVVGTPSPEAELSDADFGRWLEYGGGKVVRLDPEGAYRAGGLAGPEDLSPTTLVEEP